MLVLEFGSHRGEILNIFTKIKKDHLLRASSVGRRNFDASRRGKKGLKSCRDKNAGHEPWWGGGRSACYVTPDLSYDYSYCRRETEEKGEDTKWDGNKIKQ